MYKVPEKSKLTLLIRYFMLLYLHAVIDGILGNIVTFVSRLSFFLAECIHLYLSLGIIFCMRHFYIVKEGATVDRARLYVTLQKKKKNEKKN